MTYWDGKRVLVTGGSGFIGSHLTRKLVGLGAEVAITTKYDSVIDNVRVVDLWDKIKVYEADLRNLGAVQRLRDFKPDILFHLAAYNHVGDSFHNFEEALNSNMLASANVMEVFDDGLERFVYISTSEVYGYQTDMPFVETMQPQPISPYSIGKYGGELYCRMKMEQMNRPMVAVRPFNAFGPYQSHRAVISEIIFKCLSGRPIDATEGRQTREFNYVTNLVDGFLLAAQQETALGQLINIGSGDEISIRDLITTIHRETNSSSQLNFGALPNRDTEIWRMGADNARAKQLLNWEPTVSFLEGIRKTIEWYELYINEYLNEKSALNRLASF